MYKNLTSPPNDAQDPSTMADITESSSSDGSPASIIPSGDVTLDKDMDSKTLKQNLYDLKLRIYYMEQKNKYLGDDDGGDIYQKYVDLQTEFEKLKKSLDEKDELLLKAQKVTLYLREEKEKTLYEFQEKEKLFKENIQQLEKELEEMKLNDPKFGLRSSSMAAAGGDSAIDSSSSLCVSALSKQQHTRISELECQLNQLNLELESVKANNDQLEQTVFNLQRKINLSNKEVAELTRELNSLHKERDLYVEKCTKRDELLNKMEKQKIEMSEKLCKVEQENESLRSALTSNADQNGTSKNDKGTAVIIQRLLIENKKVNGRLRKVKEDLLQFHEQCSTCAHCANEKKLKKAPILNLRSAQPALATTSEDECGNKCSGASESETEVADGGEKYANTSGSELKVLLRERDESIKQLKNELKKRTFNLQELVNKELWDKNREIEKLNKMNEKRKKENDLLRKQLNGASGGAGAGAGAGAGGGGGGGGGTADGRATVSSSSPCGHGYGNAMRELQPCSLRNYKIDEKENISCMSDDVKLLKEHLRSCLEEKRALMDKISSLESKAAASDEERRSQCSLIRNLQLECVKRKDHFEEAEKARKEAFNACALLTSRLEELACFLESLLAHDAAGAINAKKRVLLKQAIERSREISKSFSCTFNYVTPAAKSKSQVSSIDLSAPILPDCSEINLSFSGGEDDEDDDDNYDNNEGDDYELATAVVKCDDGRKRASHPARVHLVEPNQSPCKSSSSIFDRMARSTDFASTEDSDLYCDSAAIAAAPSPAISIKKSISFVRHLGSGNELVFSSSAVGLKSNDTYAGSSAAASSAELSDHRNLVADQPLPSTTTRLPCTRAESRTRPPPTEMQNSITASSAIVSLDEAPTKIGDYDSESETWSEPDRNVSAARIGLTTSASKVHGKRLRSEVRSNSDSDASSWASAAAKKCPDAADIRQMQKRIHHLESINESLRQELEYSRLTSSTATAADKKTDMEKLSEKTKLRNLLNKINLENCVDSSKYRDAVEVLRKHLRELSKHLAKTNKLDKFVSLKLKEICEHFELSELCCSRLNQQLEEAKTRNDVLAELLEETQSKFEQVMIDLRATKLAYNGVLLEHEQNIFKYRLRELTNEQLKQKLKSADELCRALEARDKSERESPQTQTQSGDVVVVGADTEDAAVLRDMLEKASKRIEQLESLVSGSDTIGEELELCKRNVQMLGEANEKLLRDVEELDAYKAKIDEYECQLDKYRKNCEKLESELFEKESVEKLYEERCAELERQIHEKDTIRRSLKLADDELRKARCRIDRLEKQVDELGRELRETEQNARLDRECHALELKNEKERNALLLQELKDGAQRELAEKTATVDELKTLLEMSDDRTRKFENEIQLLRSMLKTCEEEKRQFRAKIALQTDQHENLKRQHEQKMKHLLSQIIAYRTEEETSLAAHRELVQQIEQAQNKKQLWRRSIREWKNKYEELKKEKQDSRDRLFLDANADANANSATDGAETAVVSKTIFEPNASANTDIETDVADFKVHHLENIKCQLEKRVKELEKANVEMELRLRRLQSTKISPSDFDVSSEEENERKKLAEQIADATWSTAFKNTITYTSCSLPNSPSHTKRPCTPLASSVPNSPTGSMKVKKATATDADCQLVYGCENYSDEDYDDIRCIKMTMTPTRKHSNENSATSPDLGIDSDHGRNSSSFEFDSGNGGETRIRSEIVSLEEENKSLKRELGQTKKELEETLSKLTSLNKNKKRMEKAIFKQIFETKHILKRARVNLEDANSDTNPNNVNGCAATNDDDAT